MPSNQNSIVRYLKTTVIDGYMLGDLERMIAIPVVPDQIGNCNFPIVLYIFSCMEFLGMLVAETPIPDRTGATRDRVWAYMELTFENYLQEFEQYRHIFIQIFRNGLAHEFFAKNAGISRQGYTLFGTSRGGKIVLDADRFYRVFRDSCNNLKSQLDASEELSKRISTRYSELQQHNQTQWPAGSSTPPVAMASMATLPREYSPDQAIATPSLPQEDED